ncbi:lipopolysaccharide biosynthesis protein [Methylomonas sp. MED-D]|uniref:lipopolysaccharide biosynthesis protein n=1 Tax=unclassified Methylomonas TaxID=2608980 RepID=UPI0028A3F4DE|nr:lipopolysaccharide biosynthesis protein [Methylomonas sp. MV1]MDT4330079.1 lipopolysaccharide biosynthesis protein [Methylomonas sp. MV1]
MSILNSVKWNYLGVVIKGVSQLAVLGVMARLLTPEEFGLMALALVAVKFGGYFSDFGLSAAIQQKDEIDDADIQSSFWFSLVTGVVFCAVTVWLAEPLSVFFESPKLVPVIQLMAFNFVLIGAAATSTGLIKRRMQFKYLSILETVNYLISNGLIGIVLAYLGYGVYSLAIANLSQSLILLIACYFKTKHTLRINLRMSAYKHILTFGGGYSVASFMTFVGSNIDHILVGKFFESAELGLWNRSRNIISLPAYNLLVSITRVLLPAYSRYQQQPDLFAQLYLKSLTMTGFFLIPVGAGMYAAAPQLVDVLLGANWQSAVPFVCMSALFVPIEMLASVAATACSALGVLSMQIRLQIYLLILSIPAMLYYAVNHQLQMILWVLTGYYWLRFTAYILILGYKLKIKVVTHLQILGSQLACGAWVAALIYLLENKFAWIGAFRLLPAEAALGGIGLMTFIVFGPARYFRAIIREFLAGRSAASKTARMANLILKKGY